MFFKNAHKRIIERISCYFRKEVEKNLLLVDLINSYRILEGKQLLGRTETKDTHFQLVKVHCPSFRCTKTVQFYWVSKRYDESVHKCQIFLLVRTKNIGYRAQFCKKSEQEPLKLHNLPLNRL